MEFQYYLPVNLIFGAGKLNVLGSEAKKYGKKALIVTGTNSTKATGVLDRAIRILQDAKVEVILFDRVRQNPTVDIAEEGSRIARSSKCDMIIGIGGGSIMDCAKAIGFMVYNEGSIFDYIYGKKFGSQSLPLLLVPTTCGTGSEGNCFAVLTDHVNHDKKSLRNMASIAKVSIIDPELMATMPKQLLATVGYDALCHNMEAYLSKATQPLIEIQTIAAMEMIVSSLPGLYQCNGNIEDYSRLSLASLIGGMAINMSGVIAPHGMEHPASGLRDVVHGSGLAALSPVIYEKTIEFAPVKFRRLATIFGGQSEKEFIKAYMDFMEKLNLRISLSQIGVRETDIDWMTENCFKVSDAAMRSHPKQFSKEEVRELYYQAL